MVFVWSSLIFIAMIFHDDNAKIIDNGHFVVLGLIQRQHPLPKRFSSLSLSQSQSQLLFLSQSQLLFLSQSSPSPSSCPSPSRSPSPSSCSCPCRSRSLSPSLSSCFCPSPSSCFCLSPSYCSCPCPSPSPSTRYFPVPAPFLSLFVRFEDFIVANGARRGLPVLYDNAISIYNQTKVIHRTIFNLELYCVCRKSVQALVWMERCRGWI
jgi:hypothetical protein